MIALNRLMSSVTEACNWGSGFGAINYKFRAGTCFERSSFAWVCRCGKIILNRKRQFRLLNHPERRCCPGIIGVPNHLRSPGPRDWSSLILDALFTNGFGLFLCSSNTPFGVGNCMITNKTKNEFQFQKRLASFLRQRAHRFPTIHSEAPNSFLVCLISQLGLKEFCRIFTLPSKSLSFVFGQFSPKLVGIIGKSAVLTIRGAVQLRSSALWGEDSFSDPFEYAVELELKSKLESIFNVPNMVYLIDRSIDLTLLCIETPNG